MSDRLPTPVANEVPPTEGFLGRWSRRKQQLRSGQLATDPVPKEQSQSTAVALPVSAPTSTASAVPSLEPVPLTMADVEALGIDSDFKPFVADGVAPAVKNAAFKKLFADPHFNVMDGLDIYIDDYGKPSPLPDSVLRQMASAKFLKLFDEAPATPGTPRTPEMPEMQPLTPANDSSAVVPASDGGELPSPTVAQLQPTSPPTDDHHADLRLQPDDAPGAQDARDRTV